MYNIECNSDLENSKKKSQNDYFNPFDHFGSKYHLVGLALSVEKLKTKLLVQTI